MKYKSSGTKACHIGMKSWLMETPSGLMELLWIHLCHCLHREARDFITSTVLVS